MYILKNIIFKKNSEQIFRISIFNIYLPLNIILIIKIKVKAKCAIVSRKILKVIYSI